MSDAEVAGLWVGRTTASSLEELAEQQAGVVARAQLRLFGVTKDLIRSQVRARRWRLAARTVVIMDRGQPNDRQRRWLAVLAAGPRAALCGLTAVELDGLRGFRDDDIHVVVPHGFGSRVPRLAGLRIHESRRFSPSDVHPARLPPRTRTARSVIDAAGWSPTATRAAALVAAAIQQRLVTVAALRAELVAIGRLRYCRLLSQTLDDIDGGAQSLAELRMGTLCRRAGLPPPQRQVIRTDATGRRRYLDLFWPDRNLWVEVDGGFHWSAETWHDDLLRVNSLVLANPDLAVPLRFPAAIIRTRPDTVINQLTLAQRRTSRDPTLPETVVLPDRPPRTCLA